MLDNNDINEINDISSDNSIIPISEQKVHILITDADTHGTEITKIRRYHKDTLCNDS